MILGFVQRFPWKYEKEFVWTNFREKILSGQEIWRTEVGEYTYYTKHLEALFPGRSPKKIWIPKLHTIREDKFNRWRPGMGIQMIYRGPKYSILDHFNKEIPELQKCISVQRIHIWRTYKLSGKEIFNVMIDRRRLSEAEILTLALNDGLPDVKYFKRWFKKDFTGKIIHWTDLKY